MGKGSEDTLWYAETRDIWKQGWGLLTGKQERWWCFRAPLPAPGLWAAAALVIKMRFMRGVPRKVMGAKTFEGRGENWWSFPSTGSYNTLQFTSFWYKKKKSTLFF